LSKTRQDQDEINKKNFSQDKIKIGQKNFGQDKIKKNLDLGTTLVSTLVTDNTKTKVGFNSI
jgi:hypothetical protein